LPQTRIVKLKHWCL